MGDTLISTSGDISRIQNTTTAENMLCFVADTKAKECYASSGVRAFLTFLLVLALLLGLFGNVLLCAIVYRRSAMRSAINLLLANIALTDFLLTLLHVPISLAVLNLTTATATGKWPFGAAFCQFNGFIFQALNCEKAVVLLIISIDRYFIIVKRCDNLTPYKSKLLIASSWLFSFTVALPPVLGWGKFRFTPGSVKCLVVGNVGSSNATHAFTDNDEGFIALDALAESYIIFASVISVLLPGVVLLFVYYRILQKVRRNGFRVQNHPPVTPTAMHKKGKYFIDYGYKTRMSTTILLLSLFFLIANVPLGVVDFVIAVKGFGVVSMISYTGFLILSYFHCSASPLLYYWRIKKYREIVKDIASQIFVFPRCVLFSAHRERRVRPHILYKVETTDNKHIKFRQVVR